MRRLLKVLRQRFYNYGTLTAVVAFVLNQLLAAEVIDATALGKYQQIAEYVLYVLVIAGFLNNPTSGKGFKDTK
jgi:uncharacterized membrane protein